MMNINNLNLLKLALSQNFRRILLAVVVGLTLMFGLYASPMVSASNHEEPFKCGVDGGIWDESSGTCKNKTAGDENAEEKVHGTIKSVLNFFSWIIGIVAVVMIIYAGFRYITSGGSSEGVKGARNTLIYAIVGLIIVLLAQIIVRYFVDQVTS